MLLAGTVSLACLSRSPQIVAAARLLVLSWACSLQIWILLDGPARGVAFGVLDLALAIGFLVMSRGRWFPAPLFFLHVMLVGYNLFAASADINIVWIGAILNRGFEAALLYVAACAAFKISVRRTINQLHS